MVKTYFKDFYISPQVAYITGVVIKIDWMEEKYEERKDTQRRMSICVLQWMSGKRKQWQMER